MNLLNKILQTFIGNKSDRDIQSVQPILAKMKEFEAQLTQESADGLRAVSKRLKQTIQDAIQPFEDKITSLQNTLENDESISFAQREEMYDSIDNLKRDIDTTIEQTLKEILPETFALVKETSRRFAQNETIEVIAQDFDRNLAAVKESVKISNDKAIWSNSWIAGGNKVTWDMVHYDVQLIGGTILHDGKIAEMGTGEGKTLVATLPVFLNALPGKGFGGFELSSREE